MGLALVLVTSGSLLALAAAPAQAASGANVVLTSPYCGSSDGGSGAGLICAAGGGATQQLSSHDGLTAKLTAAAWGGDDAQSAVSAHFFIRRTPTVGTEVWVLAGVDSTPAQPDGGPIFASLPRPFSPGGSSGHWQSFEINLNTAALPGGITAPLDIWVSVCGEGTTSFDAFGAFDLQDRNTAGSTIIPIFDCSNDLGATLGFDSVGSIAINNTLPVVNLPDYPNTGYHGDALPPVNAFTITAHTTPDAQEVSIALCDVVAPDADSPGTQSFLWGGGGGCLFPGGALAFMLGGPTTWTASFSASGPADYALPLGLVNDSIRVEVNVDNDGTALGVMAPATSVTANHYVNTTLAATNVSTTNLVWDYENAPGDRQCDTGASAATSVIDPWRLTDTDGDNAEGLATAPAPDAGVLDIDDLDNPVLKYCVKGPAGVSFPILGARVAYEIAGPGDIDADMPTYRDPGAFVCPVGTPFCSGGYAYALPTIILNGYARPGSIADAPLVDPLGRGISRVCARRCQHSDITDLGQITAPPAFLAGIGADYAAVNSVRTGTSTYKACVDLNGDTACGTGEVSDTATMVWTAAGRNHNHLWKTGTESVDGHSGTATVAAPAGSTVSLTGILHDGGHNGVPNGKTLWRLGLNAPGHFVSTTAVSDALGKSVAVIGSSVLDAARTTPVFFCGDGDADGICDFTPAQVEINWGGVVTATSISGFNTTPTIAVFGKTFTSSGTLKDVANAPVSSATISIQRRVIGSPTWTEVGTAVTSGTGAFSLGDVPAHTSDYRAVFAGNVSYSGSTSGTDRAWVRVGIALNASDPTVFAGDTVRLSGRVLPATPNGVVTLQRLSSTGPVNVASTRLSAASTYAFTVRHATAKSILYRVVFPTQGLLNAWNVSRWVRVTWA